jgi:hypothetical protein
LQQRLTALFIPAAAENKKGAEMTRRMTAYDQRRRERRDSLWPDAKAAIYDKSDENGFCTVPRTLVLVSALIRFMSKNDPSRVYLDLWMRQRDDGYVDIEDAAEMAAASGLTGTRAIKSWREKLDELQRLGFIRIRGKGNQKYKYILLLHPHDVVQLIRQANGDRIPDWWWSYFETRTDDIKARLRLKPVAVAADEDEFPAAVDDDDLPF